MERREKGSVSEKLTRVSWILHRLVVSNLVCFIVALPVIAWFYLVINSYVHAGQTGGMVDMLPGLAYFAGLLLRLPPAVFYLLFALSAVLIGPFLLGLHYMTGAMVEGRHVWISDLFDRAWQNVRQGVFLGVLSVVVIHLLLWNIFGGLSSVRPWLMMGLMVSRWGSLMLLILLLLTLPFAAQIIVSMEQPIRTVLKNAVILARVYLGRGLLALLGIAVYWWVTVITMPVVSLLTLPLLSIGLTALVQARVCRPVVERRLVEPVRDRTGEV